MSEKTEDEKAKKEIEEKVVRHIIQIKTAQEEKTDETASLKDENQILKNKLTAMALSKLEDEKRSLLEQYSGQLSSEDKDRIEDEIVDPESLGLWRGRLEAKEEAKSQKRAPTGKIKFPIETDNPEKWNSVQSMVDSIYDTIEKERFLRDMGEKYDVAELDKAEKMADRLFGSVLEGIQNRRELPKYTVRTCSVCGSTVLGENTECPICGEKKRGKPTVWRGTP